MGVEVLSSGPLARQLAGKALVSIAGGGYAYVGFAVGGCITNLLR